MVNVIDLDEPETQAKAKDVDANEEHSVEQQVFKAIAENNADRLKQLFLEHNLKPDLYDKDGMTPLQHACYKGNTEIARFLIEKGANVNDTQHEHKYTALHFAALSGNSDTCLVLLSAGAKTHAVNTIGKTAAKMAAFVGNHTCVTIINNYIPQADVDYFTVPRGFETKPKLLPILSSPLYSFIMQVNIHPVRLAMKVPKVLIEEYSQVKQVLELLSEREVKKGSDCNEVLSFKFHYLYFILKEIHKIAISKKETDPAEVFAKRILKGPRGEEYLEMLLRDCITEFPYREGLLFQQMVKCLARRAEAPPAINVVIGAINSQSNFNDNYSPCVTCSEPKAIKKCSKCKAVQYCDRECQRLHWFMHKKECARASTNSANTSSDAGKDERDTIKTEEIMEGLDKIKME